MYNEKIEALISAALADGVLTEKEKQILFKKAQAAGIDLDEFEMVLDARLVELLKAEKEKAEKSAPKSTKYGDVRKCPVCGAMVPALTGMCPECGYEFSGVEANLSSKKLAELLLKEKDFSKKEEIIITFPIPNTKSDLFEFISSIQPRLRDTNDFFSLSEAYFKKYQECINKAQTYFANDPIFQPYISSFEKEKRQIKIQKIKRICANNKGWVIAIVIALIIAISSICSRINSAIESAHRNSSKEKIEMSIQNGDAESVMSAVQSSVNFYHPLELLTQLVENGYLDAAMYFYNNKTSHCSTYDMKWTKNDSSFSKKACKLLYDALILAERMDEAWQYHPLEYETPTYAGNANSYFSYVSDVVNSYCKKGNKAAARKFVKEHLVWFVNNVDNGKYGKEYPDFQSAKVNQRLLRQINNY